MLAFLAQDADTRVFCYANGELRKDQQNDEVLRFVEFWKERTGRLPEELIFDSKLTTYANLDRLNQQGIEFITLRRRSKNLLGEVAQTPASAWRRIELESVSRAYRTPRVLDRRITLPGYDGPLRQLTIADLGHEDPTLLLTNQLTRSASHLIGRYAQRMLIENNIEDGIDFFHMDALSSAVAMKVNCDLQLTLMASSLYRLLAGPRRQRLRDRQVAPPVPRPRGRLGRRSRSPRATSRCGSRSVPTTRCWSPPGSTRPTSPSPGWEASASGSSSDDLGRVRRPGVV